MGATKNTLVQPTVNEEVLFDLVEEITRRLQAGESVDIEAYVQKHPEHAERLLQVFPALEVLADLESSVEKGTVNSPLPQQTGLLGQVLGDYRIVR
ncbi:MAG: hypothetical protein IH899_11095, partial [Planctomycetes bacterium]|nr:hypothetical protein [Planctomycetota bacterium]